jgi:hypothetical protein
MLTLMQRPSYSKVKGGKDALKGYLSVLFKVSNFAPGFRDLNLIVSLCTIRVLGPAWLMS